METTIDYTHLVNSLPHLYVRYELALRGVDYFPLTVEAKKQRLIQILRQEEYQNVCRLNISSVLPEQSEIDQCRDELNIILGENTNAVRYSFETAQSCLYFLRYRVVRLNGRGNLRELYDRAANLVQMTERRNDAANCSASLRQAFIFDLTSTSRGLDSPDFSGFQMSEPEQPSGNPNPSPISNDRPVPGIFPRRDALLRSTNPFLNEGLDPIHVPALPQRPIPTERRIVSDSAVNQRERIWQWDLKYTGDDPRSSASEFLQVLMDRSISRNVSRENILYSMTDLLGGTALKWFRSISHIQPFRNWNEFVRKFLEDFEPNHLNDGLLETISKRRQLQGESIIKYFSDIENMFWRLHVVPDEVKRVSIIRKNLLPHYVQALSLYDFNTVALLKDACKKLELGYQVANQNAELGRSPAQQINMPVSYNRFPNHAYRPAYTQQRNNVQNNFTRPFNNPNNQNNVSRWRPPNQTRPQQYQSNNYGYQTAPQNSRQINLMQSSNYEHPDYQCQSQPIVDNSNPCHSTHQSEFLEPSQSSSEFPTPIIPVQERQNLINVNLTANDQSISENLNGAGAVEPTPTPRQ